jgi:predicted PurR-regulated permease PerM
MVCLVMGVYYGVALSVADVGLGLVIGLMSGVLTFVPYLGMLSGVTLAMGMAFAQTGDWTLPLIVAGIFLAGNLVENNYLVPKLVGDRIGLHPLWVIFALMAGGALAGMVGLLLAVPVAAIAGVILRYVISRYLESPLYYGNGQS